MEKLTLLGIDIAKNVFQLHGVDDKGNAVLSKRLTRNKLLEFIAKLQPCIIVIIEENPKMSYESLSHSKWDCKYHLVFIPKFRKKVLYGRIRKFLGPVFHELARQRDCEILKGHMVQDHVHMLIKVPPKYSIAQVVGYISERPLNHTLLTKKL